MQSALSLFLLLISSSRIYPLKPWTLDKYEEIPESNLASHTLDQYIKNFSFLFFFALWRKLSHMLNKTFLPSNDKHKYLLPFETSNALRTFCLWKNLPFFRFY